MRALEHHLRDLDLAIRAYLAATLAVALGRNLSQDRITVAVEGIEDRVVSFLSLDVDEARPFDELLGEVGSLMGGEPPSIGPGAAAAPSSALLAHAVVARQFPPSSDWRAHGGPTTFDLGNVDCAVIPDTKLGSSSLRLYYDGALFDPARMKVLLRTLSETVRQTAESPAGHPIADIDLVPSDLKRQLLVDFNDTRHDYPRDRTVVDLLDDSVSASPDAPAITFGTRTLTYRELDGRANALAAVLRAEGVRKGDIVALLIGNSLELPVSIVAAMKLGAVFIPLDDRWPADRTAALLRDIDPRVVVIEHGTEPPRTLEGRSMAVDVDALERYEAPPREEIGPHDLIYGFPTSGSSGLPKCALNLHGGLVNRFTYMTRRYASDAREVVLQNSRHVFDSSMWQLLWPLTNGARVIIPDPAKYLDLEPTIQLIEEHGVTMTDFVPSVFNVLVDMLERDPGHVASLRSLRHLLIGGEEINARCCHGFNALLPDVQLTNTYGPTEASIGMVFHAVSVDDGDPIPLGRPIDNTHAVILDSRLRPVPPGVIGELYIGGDCLGAGYLNDPDRTARAFVANPFRELPGDRLYRTGDLTYQEPDGTLFFVGRVDHQVQLAGLRVELGEIEHALMSLPGVREAVVVALDGVAGKQLVAYLTTFDVIEVRELRERLSRLLPDQLIPSRFVVVDSLPLTHNGKVDRRRLERAREADGPGRPAPESGPEETVLREIWAAWLELDDFSSEDDFFALGGSSLLVLHMRAEIADRLDDELPLHLIYENPTIGGLASVVRARREGSEADGVLQSGPGAHVEAERARALVKDLTVPHRSPGYRPEQVFVTGATGFVGAHVLAELLTSTPASVLFLTREGDPAAATTALRRTLARYGLWQERFAGRIRPVAGNVEAPRLGQDRRDWQALAERADAIVHCAGMVDFLHDYAHHRAANVEGTARVLELAAHGAAKPVHHLSSLSALGPGGPFRETTPAAAAPAPTGGYSFSKWVTEQVVDQAREHGVETTMLRLGEVMPHAALGVPNPRSLAHLLLRACVRLRIYPGGLVTMDYSPADWVARQIVEAVATSDVWGSTLHIYHPRGTTLDGIMEGFRALGAPVEPVAGDTFLEALEWHCDRDGDRGLQSLLCVLLAAIEDADASHSNGAVDVALSSLFVSPSGACSRGLTSRLLHRSEAAAPAIDLELLRPVLAHLRDEPHDEISAWPEDAEPAYIDGLYERSAR